MVDISKVINSKNAPTSYIDDVTCYLAREGEGPLAKCEVIEKDMVTDEKTRKEFEVSGVVTGKGVTPILGWDDNQRPAIGFNFPRTSRVLYGYAYVENEGEKYGLLQLEKFDKLLISTGEEGERIKSGKPAAVYFKEYVNIIKKSIKDNKKNYLPADLVEEYEQSGGRKS